MNNLYKFLLLPLIVVAVTSLFSVTVSTFDITWSILSGGVISSLNLIVVTKSVQRFFNLNSISLSYVLSSILFSFKFVILASLIWFFFKYLRIDAIGFSIGFFLPLGCAIFYTLLNCKLCSES